MKLSTVKSQLTKLKNKESALIKKIDACETREERHKIKGELAQVEKVIKEKQSLILSIENQETEQQQEAKVDKEATKVLKQKETITLYNSSAYQQYCGQQKRVIPAKMLVKNIEKTPFVIGMINAGIFIEKA